MAVIVEVVTSEELEAKVQDLKNSGRRILDITVSKFKKIGPKSNEFEVTEYKVISQ